MNNAAERESILQDRIAELETELSETQKQIEDIHAVLESSFDGILITDGQGKVLMLNKAYERLTGLKEEEMIGTNMRDHLNPEYMPRSVALLVLEEKKPVTIPQITRNNRSITVTGNPVFNEKGEIHRVITNVRDITELNSLRQELLRAQAMEKVYAQLESAKTQGKGEDYIAVSEGMKLVFATANKVSSVDATVLILGESGVGKEVVAGYIHENSPRSKSPFIVVNCGAIPEQLLESELFGYAPGAFTGAARNGKAGLFETAQGGTLFLDEIGELPLSLQVKILRVLEAREIMRVGSTKTTAVDVRILAATNRDLEQMVANKRFRADLFYRLNVIRISIPPLRDRVDDIAPLSLYYLNLFNNRYHQKKRFSYEIKSELERYPWPGNIRELKNAVEQMVVLGYDEFLQTGDLPWYQQQSGEIKARPVQVSGIIPLKQALEETEKQLLENTLKKYRTSRQISRVIGIDQSTVVRKLNKYGLSTE
ncbi:MAG: sigma 54-interacting transcriptional regulator [Syntrophomonadaceae bacterium]|nr:sigma 54-interacting transcriptional regulator [Syntrophomonadaceae bacterium]